MPIFGFISKWPTPFELRLFSILFALTVAAAVLFYAILSETDVKKCRKACKELGFNYRIYTPPGEYGVSGATCECCKKAIHEGHVRIEDCEKVPLQ